MQIVVQFIMSCDHIYELFSLYDYNLILLMIDLISNRYSKKIAVDSFGVSKTSQLYIDRKESAQSTRTDSFRYNKYLPRLQPMKESHIRQVNFSTEGNKTQVKGKLSLYRSHKHHYLNYSKINTIEARQKGEKNYVVTNRQGKRPYNQDRYFCKVKNQSVFSQKPMFSEDQVYDLYAIFDGHGGISCAQFLKNHFGILLSRSRHLHSNPQLALKQTIQKCEQRFIQTCENSRPLQTSGSCLISCMIMGQKIIVGNVGDSRALLISQQNILQMTKDHKPEQITQKMRIIRHGGKIYKQHEGYINQIKLFRRSRVLPGNLNVSRTIGDIQVKQKRYGGLPGMISSIPDILTFQKNQYEILLIASDGLFEAFSNEDIHKFYLKMRQHEKSQGKNNFLSLLINGLADLAEKKSSDNITVIGVSLQG